MLTSLNKLGEDMSARYKIKIAVALLVTLLTNSSYAIDSSIENHGENQPEQDADALLGSHLWPYRGFDGNLLVAASDRQPDAPVRGMQTQRTIDHAPQRTPQPLPSGNRNIVLSQNDNGLLHRGTYKSEKSMYFERAARYQRRAIQSDRSERVQNLLGLWGVELEEVKLKIYDGVRQTPFENPSSRNQHGFNASLARGTYAPDGSENIDVFLLRIRSLRPGGLFERLGAQEGDYLQTIYDGPTSSTRNQSLTGYRSLERLIVEMVRWKEENARAFNYTVIISRLGYRAQDLWIETGLTVPQIEGLGVKPVVRKQEVRYVNINPRDSLANTVQITYSGGYSGVLTKSMTEGSFARYLFWLYGDNDPLQERLHRLALPAAAEAFSDICRQALDEPISYTPVRRNFVGEEGAGIPGGVVTRYYEEVKGKTIWLERTQLDAYQGQLSTIFAVVLEAAQEAMVQSQELVPYYYSAFEKVGLTTNEFRQFFQTNGCRPVGKAFMSNFTDFIKGKTQKIEAGMYPGKITVFAEAEEHLYAYVPEGVWPKDYKLLPGTKTYSIEILGQAGTIGRLRRMAVGTTKIYAVSNPKVERNKPGMAEAMGDALLTHSKGMECSYHGRPDRWFWKEVSPKLPESSFKLLSAALEPMRDSCPLNYTD
ncbi:MAG: hypothetical protein NXI15_02810 [Gammaproteobacteria bacterium]|nr:hypothetical protein [Gammaproteobacteria bacterium]